MDQEKLVFEKKLQQQMDSLKKEKYEEEEW
jgi:hypothetical protein